MTTKDVASVCRDFFLDGWTVADVLHALDRMPDGALWPHSGAPDTKDAWRMRGWMRHRLGAWRTEAGEPLRSRDQRRDAERLQTQAEARVAVERRSQELANRRQGLYTPTLSGETD